VHIPSIFATAEFTNRFSLWLEIHTNIYCIHATSGTTTTLYHILVEILLPAQEGGSSAKEDIIIILHNLSTRIQHKFELRHYAIKVSKIEASRKDRLIRNFKCVRLKMTKNIQVYSYVYHPKVASVLLKVCDMISVLGSWCIYDADINAIQLITICSLITDKHEDQCKLKIKSVAERSKIGHFSCMLYCYLDHWKSEMQIGFTCLLWITWNMLVVATVAT